MSGCKVERDMSASSSAHTSRSHLGSYDNTGLTVDDTTLINMWLNYLMP